MFRFLFSLLLLASPVYALNTSAGNLTVTPVITGLDAPWGLGFLPDGSVLVTERDGALIHVDGTGTKTQIKGVPKVKANGQGGLLDVMVPRDFASSKQIFLSFAKGQGRGAGTALAVGELDADAGRLREVKVIFEMVRGSSGGRHFGSRIVEARDGSIFLTIGDRGDRPAAQDLGTHNGAVVRVMRDGSVPASNPFVGQSGAQPHIWSYGHRNPQGAALDNKGNLWVVEHGARGGDEVNRIAKGANFGWPIISYGRHYSGAKIGEGTSKAGLEQPTHYWDPSIAPSGMMIYSGKLWPNWKGSMFVGSLKFDYISRLNPTGTREIEQLQSEDTGRVRDVVEAPDGSIWFLSVGNGTAYRIAPK